MSVEQRKQFLSELIPRQNQALPLNAETLAYEHELVAILEQTVPGRFPAVGNQILSQFLQLPRHSAMYQFTELAFGLISNNMVSDQGMRNLQSFIITLHIPQKIIHEILSIDTITINAVIHKMLETAVFYGNETALGVLLNAGSNRSKVSGLSGTRLLHLAIESDRDKIAERILHMGADPNPEEDEVNNMAYGTPLHAAVASCNLSLVRSPLDAVLKLTGFTNTQRSPIPSRGAIWRVLLCSSVLGPTLKSHG